MDIQKELTGITREIKWDIKGVIHIDNSISPLPAESRVVTEIFQSIIIKKMQKWASAKSVTLTDNAVFGRGYPDMTLIVNSDKMAIDVKSARVQKGDKISRMTLGTYDGYFLHPNEKKLHKNTLCYNDYSEHWIIAVLYEWYPQESTECMVKIRQICVGKKWQFASRTAGSGDTANMGGINSLSRLENLDSEFTDNEEFEKYWREYSLKHPRRGMQKKL